jgi:putative flippase GtrA
MTVGEKADTSTMTSKPDCGQRFHSLMEAIMRRLPFGLAQIVAPSFLGFALINGFTFGIDLLLLTLFRSVLGWPVALSLTVAYIFAFGLSFMLNRALNFRSHAPVGRQAALYVVAVVINYLAFILGVGGGLTALGAEYHLSRIIAGICEAVYIYSVMRWVIFRGPRAG